MFETAERGLRSLGFRQPEVRDVMARLSTGTTFIVVTHDPRIAERCDPVIEIVDGRIANDRAR